MILFQFIQSCLQYRGKAQLVWELSGSVSSKMLCKAYLASPPCAGSAGFPEEGFPHLDTCLFGGYCCLLRGELR